MTQYLTFLFPKGPFKGVQPFVVHAAGTHQHTLGTRNKLSVIRADGEDCLLEIPRWDFNWQGTYELGAATTVHPGDRVRLECHWDNSAANQPIVDGVQPDRRRTSAGARTPATRCASACSTSPPNEPTHERPRRSHHRGRAHAAPLLSCGDDGGHPHQRHEAEPHRPGQVHVAPVGRAVAADLHPRPCTLLPSHDALPLASMLKIALSAAMHSSSWSPASTN
jgi:hypothetical protein